MAKTICVVGSESFVGRELISHCQKKGINVVGIDKVAPVSRSYEFYEIDIRNPIVRCWIPENADVVVHLAALSRDSDCRDKAHECFDVNVMGTLNIIRVAKERKAKQFIFASTEWVYECVYNKVASEYALSKLVSEANLRLQFSRGFCDTTVFRFGIIYGPRKNNWSAVESIFNAVKNGDKVSVGSKKTGRRFIHVSDIADGIINSFGIRGFNTINLTGDRVITLEEIVQESEKILEKKVKIRETNPNNPSVRNFSNSKAKNLLNWAPKINLRDGLRSLL